MATDYFWNPAATDGDLSNANNWYPEPPTSGGKASFSNGDNWYFGGLAADSSNITTGFNNLNANSIVLGTVIWFATYQGNFGLAPQYTLEVSSFTNSTTTATATTAVNHGYAVGDTVTLSGASLAAYNGTFTIATVPSNTTFTYAMGSDPGGSSATTGKVYRNWAPIIPCSSAIVGQNVLPQNTGTGALRLVADYGTSAAAVQVLSTLNSAGTDSGFEPVRFQFNNSSATCSVLGGQVGIATSTPAVTSTLGTVTVAGSQSVVDLGRDLTYTTMTVNNGTVTDYGGGSGRTVTIWSGSLTLLNQTVVGTLNCRGGASYCEGRPASGNTINTLNLFGGNADFSGDPSQFQVGAIALRDGTLTTAYYGQLANTPTVTLDMTDKTILSVTRS